MPHRCLRCGEMLTAAEGLAPCCQSCGGTKFAYVSVRRAEILPPVPVEEPEHLPEPELIKVQKSEEPPIEETPESIRIIEPGRYDLNLLRLAETDDRVIRVGDDENYRLDLHSMVRSKKKR
ncbi:MAG TPA: Zn-ribbon containing protein [Methanospirillum sp.]|nr:Zn-ribbon containing protein [Methanospirillum sp.]